MNGCSTVESRAAVDSFGIPCSSYACSTAKRSAQKTLWGGRRRVRNLGGVTSIDELLGEARAFLDATSSPRNDTDEKFVWGEGSDRVNILEETEASEMTTMLAAAKRYAAAAVRRRVRVDRRPGRVRRPRPEPRARPRLPGARGELRAARPVDPHDRGRVRRARAARVRDARAPGRVPPEAVPRRPDHVPAVQRAERGVRSRVRAHARRARRRRVGDHRAEGVDVERARRRRRARGVPHRSRRPQAPGSHHVPRRHARAGGRGAAAAPDDGQRQLQRGVPHRRAGPRLPSRRRAQQGLRGDPHHARQRAHDRDTRAVVGSWHRTVRAVARGGRQLRRPSRRAPTPAPRAALHRRPHQGAAHRAVARRARSPA